MRRNTLPNGNTVFTRPQASTSGERTRAIGSVASVDTHGMTRPQDGTARKQKKMDNGEANSKAYWEPRPVRICEFAGAREPHHHIRLRALTSRDEAGRVNPYWPPSSAARQQARALGFRYFLFDAEGGWAITEDEARCREGSWFSDPRYEGVGINERRGD